MGRFYRQLADRRIVFLSLFFMAAAALAFVAFDRARPAGTPGIVALQLAFSAETFRGIIQQWGTGGVQAYRAATIRVDYWFPIAYSLFLGSLMALLSFGSAKRPWPTLVIMPFVAALFDGTENTLHLILLRDPSHISASLVWVASMAAAIKWGLIALSIVAILYLMVARIRGRLRSAG
jgi:hypothetical protein